ncbi:hypothetical protein B9T10_08785 [Wohlfahrtiimonas chitiniclastica]|uniref:APC family permease n=1 Tax=Wohlfahrtiimonas chitiniclastica TaxID=400946 RepID=UPI000B98CE11|nr:amino acid permease [Wohlfahrtiimonas chitiniclastica]OYQ88138.1 hypothetical protein B9T10_08785 [Wohlfahrtiimonas chitiniclastica]
MSNAHRPITSELGLISCVAFAVGSMIGGGVFALAGVVVKDTGPGALLSYLFAGIIVSLSAVSFSVVASRAPKGQSSYYTLGVELGKIWQFITMWAFYISTVTAVAFMLVSFGNYLQYFLSSSNALLLAVFALVFLVILNLTSTATVGKVENLLVGFKLLVLFTMIGFGLAAFSSQKLTPFLPHGQAPVLSSTAMLFSAYLGFSVITNMADVVKNPQKTVPLALMISIAIVTIVYMGIVFALLMARGNYNNNASLASAANILMGNWGSLLVAFTACVSTLSGSNGSLLGISELIIRMSQQGSIPKFLGRKSQSGHAQMSVLLSGCIALILMLTGDISSIIAYCSVAGIWGLVMMNICAGKIAWNKWGNIGMKLPFGILIPTLAGITATSQLFLMDWKHSVIGTLMVAAGFIIYFFRPKTTPTL